MEGVLVRQYGVGKGEEGYSHKSAFGGYGFVSLVLTV